MTTENTSHPFGFTPLLDEDGDRINVAMIIPTTHAEGPGNRFALWVQGCTMRCAGCCNPEMLAFKDADWTATDDLTEQILTARINHNIEGVTLLGGEPFAQAPALAKLARSIRREGLTVMIFTGYTLKHLQTADDLPGARDLLDACDLLVDGQFERTDLDHNRRWIGSLNQDIHALSPHYEELADDWDTSPNTLEVRVIDGKLIVNGSPFLMDKLGRVKKLKPERKDSKEHSKKDM